MTTVLSQVIPVPCLFLPPLSPSLPLQEHTEAPPHQAFWLGLLFAKIADANSVSCHKNTEAKTDKMLIPKKCRFIRLVIIACSHEMQTAAHNHPNPRLLPLVLSKSQSPPLAVLPLSPTHSLFVPPNPIHYRVLVSDGTGPARKKEKKKKTGLGRARCASLKEMLFSPSFLLRGVAASKGWSLGWLPAKGSRWAPRFLWLTTH